MNNFYWLDRIQPSERSLVGDKALHLSQLLQGGYPVAPGFVVPAIAFWDFIEHLGEFEPLLADLRHSSLYLNVDDPQQLQSVAQQIRQAIATTALPPTLRTELLTTAETIPAPSLIFQPSLALPLKRIQLKRLGEGVNLEELADRLQTFGMLASYIDLNQPDMLIQSLQRVWAELFRARSLFYLQRMDIALHQLNLAVLVQPIHDVIASGTIQANRQVWQIQATYGLGLAIAKGEVLPDFYQIQVETGKIVTSQLGSKTLAYRLIKEVDSLSPDQTCLQAYALSEAQQKQYALEEQHLQQLIELSEQLTSELTTVFSLEWAICQTPTHSEPQLYVTHFSPKSSLSSQLPILTPHFMPDQLRGLPAAAGRVTALAQVIKDRQTLEAIAPGRILVAPSIAPDWLPWLQTAVGVVTEQGGMTSHGAIIARELGIPAVVGVTGATQFIQTDELLLVDGEQGEIQRLGVGKQESSGVEEPESQRAREPTSRGGDSRFPIATQLFVNLSQPQSLARIEGLPIDGVGLLRSELMVLNVLDNLPPSEWVQQGREQELIARLTQLIVQFAAALTPRPVFYRSLDWRETELALGTSSDIDSRTGHSLWGEHGTYQYLRNPASFDVELAALRQVYTRGYSNVRLVLPFVRTVEEFAFCRRRVEQAGLIDNPHFQLWIMAEVPSVLFLLPDFVKAGVQGISIGTNDLTQLLLAVDRNQGELGSTLDGRHPAVMRAIEQLIRMAKEAGIPCSICGQAPAQYPELIEPLVEWGISSISVDVNDVERTHQAIARAEQRLLLKAARQRLEH
ncbi:MULTISPECIES: putative PEP-binding protein [unclassified Coleofasciculus]|uniref:putative PEP-binding protein n=1 Tax=unclassified Coleofasciculus TaxID=2692782 RepID=UPI001881CB75|nr:MULTISPECIES: putative PEP-binding protein [unclassified Coleofasciculus]MBE9127242.1 response regulator [Coleofasciculus sp. LEGE 07081]MBE9150606.1 response regulator [Coleofasciculus sp. LEGE 07092]